MHFISNVLCWLALWFTFHCDFSLLFYCSLARCGGGKQHDKSIPSIPLSWPLCLSLSHSLFVWKLTLKSNCNCNKRPSLVTRDGLLLHRPHSTSIEEAKTPSLFFLVLSLALTQTRVQGSIRTVLHSWLVKRRKWIATFEEWRVASKQKVRAKGEEKRNTREGRREKKEREREKITICVCITHLKVEWGWTLRVKKRKNLPGTPEHWPCTCVNIGRDVEEGKRWEEKPESEVFFRSWHRFASLFSSPIHWCEMWIKCDSSFITLVPASRFITSHSTSSLK